MNIDKYTNIKNVIKEFDKHQSFDNYVIEAWLHNDISSIELMEILN